MDEPHVSGEAGSAPGGHVERAIVPQALGCTRVRRHEVDVEVQAAERS